MNITTYGIEKESLDGLLREAADGSTSRCIGGDLESSQRL